MCKYLSMAVLGLILLLPLGCVSYPIPQLPENAGPTAVESVAGVWVIDRGASRDFNCDFDDFFLYALDADSLQMQIDTYNQTLTLTREDKEPVSAQFTVIDTSMLSEEVPTIYPIREQTLYLSLTDQARVVALTLHNDPVTGTRLYFERPDINGHDDHAVFMRPQPVAVAVGGGASGGAIEGFDPSHYHFVHYYNR